MERYEDNTRDTIFTVVGSFALFVISIYLADWASSNKGWKILGGSVVLYGLSLVLSRTPTMVLGTSFVFVGLRFAIAPYLWSLRDIVTAVLLLVLGVLGVFWPQLRENILERMSHL